MEGTNEKKRPRESNDDDTHSTRVTVYVQCKHMSKMWDLLNGFLLQNAKAVGILGWYTTEAASQEDGTTTEAGEEGKTPKLQLKHDAPVEASFASWSRKPYFLIEFGGTEGAAITSRFLSLPAESKMFRNAAVEISVARPGQTVAADKEKMHAHEPKRDQHHTTKKESSSDGAVPSVEVERTPEVQPEAIRKPSVTSFLPRALWKRR